MPVAASMIRHLPPYRADAFVEGLRRCGFRIARSPAASPSPDDVLVVWNRYGVYDQMARAYEAAGAKVIVAENGWLGHDDQGRQFYSVALSHHNGAGRWHVGDDDRFSKLQIALTPWRRDGKHILVLPQRGIGPAGVGMPKDWLQTLLPRLSAETQRPIRVRPHPGKERPPLDPDLQGAWAVVTWGSGAAISAIVRGIPVFHEFDRWIGAPAARFGIENIESPFLGDRLPMLRRLAWHQFSVAEIADGEPFRWLLGLR